MQNQTSGVLVKLLDENKVKAQKVPGVRTVLVILSSRATAFDAQALRFAILSTYPEAVVFFKSTMGYDLDSKCPDSVDLLIDLTGPGQRQSLFYSKKLRKMARFAVGRNAGLFRKKIYDRVFDEKKSHFMGLDLLEKERKIQRQVLALVGISFPGCGEVAIDLGHRIALDLPRLKSTN